MAVDSVRRTLWVATTALPRMEGFVASDFGHLRETFEADMTGWLKAGRIKYQETILDGFERAPEGLIGLFEGRNAGKMLIRAGA